MIEDSLSSLSVSGLFHGYVMTSGWIGFELLAIWSLYFRNRSKAVEYIHGAAMTCLMLLTAIGTVEILTYEGVKIITKNYYHNFLGLLITCSVPIVALLGMTVSFKQISSPAKPKNIDKLKLAHKTLGWVFIAGSRIPIYNKWIYKIPNLCLILFIFDILSHAFYFYCKISQIRLESVLIKNKTKQRVSNTQEWIRQIKNKSDLQIFHGDCFIFADFVYRLGGILSSHPAGFQIIDNIRGREVDRFLYGVESLQIFPNFKNSHTAKSIELAGFPVGRIQDCRLFPRMKQSTKVQISINKYQNNSKIHLIYLRPSTLSDIQEQSFLFQGYSDVSQLGKYYALTIHKKSRLYTVVNFLRRKNIILLQTLLKTKFCKQRLSSKTLNEDLQYLQENCFKQVVTESQISDNKSLIIKSQYSQSNIVLPQLQHEIPLLIKKYDNGQITPYLLRDSFNEEFFISKPRGRGLAFQDLVNEKKPHNIYLFSGGTGLNVYLDLIDLLFKDLVMKEQKFFASKVTDNDPILNKNPFEGLNFTFYISVETIKDIHPLTILQLELLSCHKRIRTMIKSSVVEMSILKENYSHIQFNNSRYENIIWSLKEEEVSKLYFCGPNRMTKTILLELRRLYWSPQKFYIL